MSNNFQKATECMQEGEYLKAINFYSLAIGQDKHPLSLLFSGRAKALYLITELAETPEEISAKQWKKIGGDCDSALKLDANNLDGLYYNALYMIYCNKNGKKGLSLLQEVYDKALKTNSKQSKNFVLPRDIYHEILKTKQYFAKDALNDQIVKSHSLFKKLMKHIENDYHEQLDLFNLQKLDKKTFEYATTNLAMKYNGEIKDLVKIFKNNYNHALDPHISEPPDHLCDPISFNLFMDPVVTPSGQSFERSWLYDHLEKTNTDPLTRDRLSSDQCYTNLGLKKCVDEYLESHGNLHTL